MDGYPYSLANVKCFFHSILLIAAISMVSFCEDSLASSNQHLKIPPEMKSRSGFYTPSIGICESVISSNCTIFHGEECNYVFPTAVISYYRKKNDKLYICACQIPNLCITSSYPKGANIGKRGPLERYDNNGFHYTTNSDSAASFCSDVSYDPEIGCIEIPNAPLPPPFCDFFEKVPKAQILPVSHLSQSFFDRKTKVALLDFAPILCDDQSRIDLGATCKDSSKGTRAPLVEKVQPSPIVGDITGVSDPYSRFTFVSDPNDPSSASFSYGTYSSDGEICTAYFGQAQSSSSSNTNISQSVCFPAPKMEKPEITHYTKNSISISIPKCSGSICTTQLVPGAPGIAIEDVKLRAVRPMIDDAHNFRFQVECPDKSTPQRKTLPANGIDIYECKDPRLIPVARIMESTSTSSPACVIDSSNSHDELTVNRNNRLFFLKSYGKGFVRKLLAKSPSGEIKKILCPPGREISMKSPQKTFDLFTQYEPGSYYPDTEYTRSTRAFAPSIPATDSELSSSCIDYATVYEIGTYTKKLTTSSKPSDRYSVQLNNRYVSETEYYDIDTEQPFYFTDQEYKDKLVQEKVKPIEPDLNGLCATDFKSTEYKYAQGAESVFVLDDKQCDFVSFEAWGGGESGKISQTIGTTGGAGSYISGVIKVAGSNSSLKVKVGRGEGTYDVQTPNPQSNATNTISNAAGAQSLQPSANAASQQPITKKQLLTAEDTEIDFCTNKGIKGTKCQKMVIAQAAGKNGSYASIADVLKVKRGYMKHGKKGKNIDKATSDIEITVPYLNYDRRGEYMKSTKCDQKQQNNAIVTGEDESILPGAGGCANVNTGMIQNGAHGKVRLTCEVWH